ncbi:IS3 family transposase [Streptomyces sp. NPDC057575]|uniref:IS3 family transposase n=1 Tax=unclassified Streptomyces TaxID=2593676 RepID=UPI00367F4513
MSQLYRLIHAEKANYPITLLCRVLLVARSSYYAWCEGEAARRRRQAADDALALEITLLHLASRRTYGVPRIHAELRRLGRRVNRKRIARVMRERDIRGVTRRKHRSLTRPDKKAKPAPDLIGRDFHADTPGTKLVGSGSRRELPPPAPTELCVTVSRYTALVTLSTRNGGQTASGRTSLGIAA